MALLVGTWRKDVRYMRIGPTPIKTVWMGAEKIWPRAKLLFLNTGDETEEYKLEDLTATYASSAEHVNEDIYALQIRASKNEIRLPFSFKCSSNICIVKVELPNLSGATATVTNTNVYGATGTITPTTNTYTSVDEINKPDYLIWYKVNKNTSFTNTQTSTIEFFDLLDNVDNPLLPENCEVDPITFTITQRHDSVLWTIPDTPDAPPGITWENAKIVFYTDSNCTTETTSYTRTDYTSGEQDIFFRVEAKRESGLTYYYGTGTYSSEPASALSVSSITTTSNATSATAPAQVNTTTHCWKSTISLSDNTGSWGAWSSGYISYPTNATYNKNSTQNVTITNPVRTWIATTDKSSTITIKFDYTIFQCATNNVRSILTNHCVVNHLGDTRTLSQTDDTPKFYVNGELNSVTYYDIVWTGSTTVSCTQNNNSTFSWTLPNLGSGTYYVEYLINTTFYASGYLTGQHTQTCSIGSNSYTFKARSTGTATINIIVRKAITGTSGSSLASVNQSTGVVTWNSANGDETQLTWTSSLTLSHSNCGYDSTSSTGSAATTVNDSTQNIYYKFELTTAGNAISVTPTTYSDGGAGATSKKTFTLSWNLNLGHWDTWSTNQNIVYSDANYLANSTATATITDPTREWLGTTQKSCVVKCYVTAGTDAPTRSETITAIWENAAEMDTAEASQNGTTHIETNASITCYQNADTQSASQATSNGRGPNTASHNVTIKTLNGINATINSSNGTVTFTDANGDSTVLSWTNENTFALTNNGPAALADNSTTTVSVGGSLSINTAGTTIYYQFSFVTQGSAKSLTNTGAGSTEKTSTLTWNSNLGSWNDVTGSVAISYSSPTDFKSKTLSVTRTGGWSQTYNRTSSRSCQVKCTAYAGTDTPSRNITVTCTWTLAACSNHYNQSTVSKDATATQIGSGKIYTSATTTCDQSADTTPDKSFTYKYSISTSNSGATIDSSTGAVTLTQNGGVSGKNVAYIADSFNNGATWGIDPHETKDILCYEESINFTCTNVSTLVTAGSNGTASSNRSWTVTVTTNEDSSLSATCSIQQTGLSASAVTKPSSSITYSWSLSNTTGFSLSPTNTTATTVSISSNCGAAASRSSTVTVSITTTGITGILNYGKTSCTINQSNKECIYDCTKAQIIKV